MKYFELNKTLLNNELKRALEAEGKTGKKIEKSVLKIEKEIKKNGFKALQKYSKKFDAFDLTEENISVSVEEIKRLASKIDKKLSSALTLAVKRVKDFHLNQIDKSFSIKDKEGNKMGQKIVPLESVAVYIPGGEALYPSTLYMTVVPAIIAGVKRIILLSPPRTFERSSEVAKLIELLGIKEVYRIGGAHSIFAAAYGAGVIKPVDKIVGPGNAFVAKAKERVYGKVDIDMIAGPSEILVIADTDRSEDIPLIASDLLSQAEHGPAGFTRSILIGFDKEYLLKIKEETYRQAGELPEKQKNNAIKSLDKKGVIVCCKNRLDGIELSNKFAPEHLELFSDKPYQLLEKVKNAGSVFLGKYTPEAVGDYLGGPNHVLPTSGTARFFSPLGVYDFQKRTSWIEFGKNSLKKHYKEIAMIARAEGLVAHAKSAEVRFR